MDVKAAFFEMLLAIGSSAGELLKLDIGYSYDAEHPVIHMWAVKLDSDGKCEEAPADRTGFQIRILYHSCDVDLRDPESFQKTKIFLDKVRGEQLNRSKMIILDRLT
jgi:hypothetical protein